MKKEFSLYDFLFILFFTILFNLILTALFFNISTNLIYQVIYYPIIAAILISVSLFFGMRNQKNPFKKSLFIFSVILAFFFIIDIFIFIYASVCNGDFCGFIGLYSLIYTPILIYYSLLGFGIIYYINSIKNKKINIIIIACMVAIFSALYLPVYIKTNCFLLNGKCIAQASIEQENSALCNVVLFSFKDYSSACYGEFAIRNQDPAICEKINNINEKDRCYDQIVELNEDAGLCDKIDNMEKRDWCYDGTAKSTKDLSLCDKISGETEFLSKYDCYNHVAKYNNDKSICEKIPIEKRQKFCK